jgi:1,4-alpha-glucan branching enzyme
MITKSYSKTGRACRVTFKLSPEESQAKSVVVLGDWNEWNPKTDKLVKRKDGSFSTTISVPAGQEYRFRYLLDNKRWLNDSSADCEQPNLFGTLDSVLAL